jgi:hypothetical protein
MATGTVIYSHGNMASGSKNTKPSLSIIQGVSKRALQI